MPYVQRNKLGEIVGVFENAQPGIAEEYIDGDAESLILKNRSRDEVEIKRLNAYAHPVYGSDRHFAEALALKASGESASSESVKACMAAGIAARKKIKEQNPWPEY